MIKIHCSDFDERGLTFDESRQVCAELGRRGMDAIEISGGNAMGTRRRRMDRDLGTWLEKESYFAEHAAQIADHVDIPVISVGGHRSLRRMEELLNTTRIGYFSMCRPFLREPDLVDRWRANGPDRAACISCTKCWCDDGNRCVFRKR
jgi:2,4-dienoyl-CoA reductase-like NADH-dependent reductase (Old Yellow Enzyme family)